MSRWRALPAALALLLSGCATVYQSPTDDDPHATIKYRRVYDQLGGQRFGPSFRERLRIDDHVAYEATTYAVLVQAPRVDEVRVRPELATFTSSVTLFHLSPVSTARSDLGAPELIDAVCSSSVRFVPAQDASYLLEFSFQEENSACSLSCSEQVPRPNGELENRACPAPVAPPASPRALPVTHLEVH
jgi:hypothetical protein